MIGKNFSSLIYTVPAAGALGGEQHCCGVRPPTDLTLCSAPLQKQGTYTRVTESLFVVTSVPDVLKKFEGR
jgi:hypothetical protein